MLVKAYRAGLEQRYQEAVDHSKEAWDLAAQAISFNSSIRNIAEQMQQIAEKMANDARALIGQ